MPNQPKKDITPKQPVSTGHVTRSQSPAVTETTAAMELDNDSPTVADLNKLMKVSKSEKSNKYNTCSLKTLCREFGVEFPGSKMTITGRPEIGLEDVPWTLAAHRFDILRTSFDPKMVHILNEIFKTILKKLMCIKVLDNHLYTHKA